MCFIIWQISLIEWDEVDQQTVLGSSDGLKLTRWVSVLDLTLPSSSGHFTSGNRMQFSTCLLTSQFGCLTWTLSTYVRGIQLDQAGGHNYKMTWSRGPHDCDNKNEQKLEFSIRPKLIRKNRLRVYGSFEKLNMIFRKKYYFKCTVERSFLRPCIIQA